MIEISLSPAPTSAGVGRWAGSWPAALEFILLVLSGRCDAPRNPAVVPPPGSIVDIYV